MLAGKKGDEKKEHEEKGEEAKLNLLAGEDLLKQTVSVVINERS